MIPRGAAAARGGITAIMLALAACDPVVNITGREFVRIESWMLDERRAMLAAIGLAIL